MTCALRSRRGSLAKLMWRDPCWTTPEFYSEKLFQLTKTMPTSFGTLTQTRLSHEDRRLSRLQPDPGHTLRVWSSIRRSCGILTSTLLPNGIAQYRTSEQIRTQ
jgi:hypothetical protein